MSGPKVAYVTAGGAGMFCGSCMRDNSLAAELIKQGVDITLIPTFTPIRTDEENVSIERVYLGGINVYLEQRYPWMGRMPKWMRRGMASPALLRAISKMSLQTRSEQDGAMAVSLLKGEHGHHAAEIHDLVDFVVGSLQPDVVHLTNMLIAGFVPLLKARSNAVVCVTLQGDDIFLNALAAEDRERVVQEMRRVAVQVDRFVVFNAFYRDRMAELFQVPHEKFAIVSLGLAEPDSFAPPSMTAGDRPPTLGYLARICPEKGFHRMIDAFIELKQDPGMVDVRLKVAGWLGESDRPFYEEQLRRLERAGLLGVFERIELPERDDKLRFLAELDLFSVPTEYEEPKGLYVLEAIAAGVPVVLPDRGSFAELVQATGGGELVPPDDASALAQAWKALLADPQRRAELSAAGRRGVVAEQSISESARQTRAVWSDCLP